MKNIFFILIYFGLIHALQADEAVSIELNNNNLVQMVLPPGYCDVSDAEEGKAQLKNLNKIATGNYAQVVFVKCNSTDGYPWGYIATYRTYVPSSINQIDINSMMSEGMADLTESVRKKINTRADMLLEDPLYIESVFKNTSGEPSVIWKDKYQLSLGGVINSTDVDGNRINQNTLTNVILHRNTAIYIYMYSLEGIDDNIYQYARFFQNFSKALK